MDVEYLRYKFEDGYDGIITKTKFKLGVRHVQMVYMLLCSLVMGMMRSSGTIAIISVTDLTRNNETYIQIHDWNRKTQGSILSSFFFGYAIMLFPAEVYLKQVGDKLVLTAVLLINGALSSTMPTIINKGGWLAACNAQLFIGMSQACVTPINHKLITSWLLPYERRIFSYAIHTALLLGTVIAFPITGLLAEAHLGWELVYYSQAMLILSMAAMWVLLTASTPDRHEAVGDTEKEMIREALLMYKQKKLSTPWRRIIRTRNFWGLSCAHSAANIVFIFYLSEVPVLLYSLNWSLRMSATQTAVPFVALWLVYTLTSPLTEFTHRIARLNYILDIRYFRKIINGFGSLGIVAALALTPHLILSWFNLSIAAIIMIPAFIGVQLTGFLENHKDVTENFSGTLLMMTSVIASVVGATVPFITGVVLGDDMTNIRSWKLIFTTLAALYLLCNLAYTVLASGERQRWDASEKPKTGYNNDATNMELDDIDDTKSTRHQEAIKL